MIGLFSIYKKVFFLNFEFWVSVFVWSCVDECGIVLC